MQHFQTQMVLLAPLWKVLHVEQGGVHIRHFTSVIFTSVIFTDKSALKPPCSVVDLWACLGKLMRESVQFYWLCYMLSKFPLFRNMNWIMVMSCTSIHYSSFFSNIARTNKNTTKKLKIYNKLHPLPIVCFSAGCFQITSNTFSGCMCTEALIKLGMSVCHVRTFNI